MEFTNPAGVGRCLEKDKTGCHSKKQEEHVQRHMTTWQGSRYVSVSVMVPDEAAAQAVIDQKGPPCCMEGLGLTLRSSCLV